MCLEDLADTWEGQWNFHSWCGQCWSHRGRGGGLTLHSAYGNHDPQVVSYSWVRVLGPERASSTLPCLSAHLPTLLCSSCTCLGHVQPKLLRSALLKITLQIKMWVRFLQCEENVESFSAAIDKPDMNVITSHSYLPLLFAIISFNPFGAHRNNVHLNELIWD